jgi:hypothetical protein
VSEVNGKSADLLRLPDLKEMWRHIMTYGQCFFDVETGEVISGLMLYPPEEGQEHKMYGRIHLVPGVIPPEMQEIRDAVKKLDEEEGKS